MSFGLNLNVNALYTYKTMTCGSVRHMKRLSHNSESLVQLHVAALSLEKLSIRLLQCFEGRHHDSF